jgi:hypothetical protein
MTHAMFWSELPPSFVRMGCWFAYVANPRRLSQPSWLQRTGDSWSASKGYHTAMRAHRFFVTKMSPEIIMPELATASASARGRRRQRQGDPHVAVTSARTDPLFTPSARKRLLGLFGRVAWVVEHGTRWGRRRGGDATTWRRSRGLAACVRTTIPAHGPSF